jgi:hypothetical protein
MIVAPDNFKGQLTNKDIYDAAERYGYEKYIPYGLVKDLFHVWAHTMMNKSPESAIIEETDYDKSFAKLISFIHPDMIKRTLGTEFAFNILKKYGPELNLRLIEKFRFIGASFDFEENRQYNYSFDLNSVSPEVLEMVNISLDLPVNEIELSEEIEDILKFYTGTENFLGVLEDVPKLNREEMKYYYQVMKVPKRRLVYPTFKYDYTKKNLSVKIPVVERKDKDTLIMLVDVSSSVFTNPKYVRLYKGILLHFLDSFKDNVNTLKIYYFAYDILKEVVIKSKAELKILYNSPISSQPAIKGWKLSIIKFKKLLSSEDVILLTDGNKDADSLDLTNNNSYYIICMNDNEVLKNLANKTNGKFIKV